MTKISKGIGFDPTDTGHAGAFLRKDGTRISVHVGENRAGEQGWYWAETLRLGWAENYADMVYVTGKNGIGPFKTCREACHNALESAS